MNFMKKDSNRLCFSCLLTLAATLAIASAAIAEDTMICPLAYIAGKDSTGELYRPFATEDVVGGYLAGDVTDNPAKLKAYVTVARNRLYIYSNFKSPHGYSMKIMTDRTDVGLKTIARKLIGVDTPGFESAFPKMTFFVDERVAKDRQFGGLDQEGATTQVVPAFATETVAASVVDGQLSLVLPSGKTTQILGLASAVIESRGRLPDPLSDYEGRTWLVDTSRLDDDEVLALITQMSQMDSAVRKSGGKGIRVVYSSEPDRARSRMSDTINGNRVIVRNDESLLQAEIGIIAERILGRRMANVGIGRHIRFTIGHFEPTADPLKRIGELPFNPEQPTFHVLGLCNPQQTKAFLGFARAVVERGDLGVLIPAREVDIPAMVLLANALDDRKLSSGAALYPVNLAPLAIREQLQRAAEAAADKLRAAVENRLTPDEIERVQDALRGGDPTGVAPLLARLGGAPATNEDIVSRIRKDYGEDAEDIIQMFRDRNGAIDLQRVKITLEALSRAFEMSIYVSVRERVRVRGQALVG